MQLVRWLDDGAEALLLETEGIAPTWLHVLEQNGEDAWWPESALGELFELAEKN